MGLYITATYKDVKTILYPIEDLPVRINLQTVVNGEIGDIKSDFSQPIQFAATDEVKTFFENAFEVGFQEIPGVQNQIQVTVDNEVQTIFSGTMQLNDWNDEVYECQIFSGISELADLLEGKLVADADWTDLNHTYSMDTWKATNEASILVNPNYFYPFADLGYDEDGRTKIPDDAVVRNAMYQNAFGNPNNLPNDGNSYFNFFQGRFGNSTTVVNPTYWFGEVATGESAQGSITSGVTPMRIDQLKPAVKLSSVFDKLFEHIGHTYEFVGLDKLNDAFVWPLLREKSGINLDASQLSSNNEFVLQAQFGTGTSTESGNLDVNRRGVARQTSPDATIWKFGSTDISGKVNQASGSTANFNSPGVYTVPNDGGYTFNFKGSLEDFSGQLDNVFNNAYLTMQVAILKNGVTQERFTMPHINNRDTPTNNDPDRSFAWDLDASFNCRTNDIITAELQMKSGRSADTLNAHLKDVTFATKRVGLQWDGIPDVNIGLQFEDTTWDELLPAITEKFFLVLYRDLNRPTHWHIQQYFDWINTGIRLDWSDKVVSMTQANQLQGQPKVINFQDAEGDDRVSLVSQEGNSLPYGTHTFTSEDDGITSGDKTIGDFFTPTVVASPTVVGDIQRRIEKSNNGIPHIYEVDGEDTPAVSGGIKLGYSKVIDFPGGFYYAKDATMALQYNQRIRTFSNTNQMNTRDLNYSNVGEYSDAEVQDAYSTYWEPLNGQQYTDNVIKMMAELRLSPEDLADIYPLNNTVHINGTDYIVSKIDGFDIGNEGVSMVELISYKNNFPSVLEEATISYVTPLDASVRQLLLGVELIDTDIDGIRNPISKASITSKGMITFEGDNGDTDTATIVITRGDGAVIKASDFTTNADSLPGITTATPVQGSEGTVTIEVTSTIQASNVFRKLTITGMVLDIAPNVRDVDITWQTANSSTPNAFVATSSPQEFLGSSPGTTFPACLIGAVTGNVVDTQELTASMVTITTTLGDTPIADVMTFSHWQDAGSGAIANFNLNYPEDENYDITVTFDLPITATSPIDPLASPVTVGVTFVEQSRWNRWCFNSSSSIIRS